MPATISPSRATDFVQCPLLYRFRVLDRLPEAPRPAAVRGTLVHAVLDRLFDLPADRRTRAAARTLISSQWARLLAEDREAAELFAASSQPRDEAGWLSSAADLVERWFVLEDPTRLDPLAREAEVRATLDGGLTLHGFVDRLDRQPDGRLTVVDYKSGRAPASAAGARPPFQLLFYALVLRHTHGLPPATLQLVCLGDSQVLRYSPDEADLLATETRIRALCSAIDRTEAAADWLPSPGRWCAWCVHWSLCPAKGGTLPPVPRGVSDRPGACAVADGERRTSPGTTAETTRTDPGRIASRSRPGG